MILTNRLPVLFTLAVAIAGVSAQSSNVTLDSCGQSCINTTVAAGYCSSAENLTCVCTSTQFQNTLASCLTKNCSTSDLTIAVQIQKEECANVTNSTSSTTPSASASAKSSSSPSGSSTSNAAAVVDQLPLLSTVIVIAGALMGGAFVL